MWKVALAGKSRSSPIHKQRVHLVTTITWGGGRRPNLAQPDCATLIVSLRSLSSFRQRADGDFLLSTTPAGKGVVLKRSALQMSRESLCP